MEQYFLLLMILGGAVAQTRQDVQGALNLFKTPSKGKGSYYGPGLDTGGTCRLINPKPAYANFKQIKMDVAMNQEQFFGSLACGMCLKVNHEVEGEFYAYVQDKCGGCGPGGLDLGVMGHGKPPQTIQAVQCPVGNSPMQYKIEGNPWNWKVQIRNARVPISEFSVKQLDGSYKALKLQNYGAFTGSVKVPTSGKHDVAVRMKSVNGFVIDDVIPQVDYSLQTPHTGSAQVPLDSSLPKMTGDTSSGGKVAPGGGGKGTSGKGGKGTGGKGGKGTGGKGGKGTGGKGRGGKGGNGRGGKGRGGKGGKGRGGKGRGGKGGKGRGGKGGKVTGGGKTKGPFSCKNRANGTYGDPGDCSSFVQCAEGRLFRFKCQNGLKFDLNIMNCNHAGQARCA